MTTNNIEVCFSPLLFPLFDHSSSVVVVIDVFRATSAMLTAFENGVKTIIPVSKVEEAREYAGKGFLAAAERDGKIVEGFDLGNSPFSYMDPAVKGKDVVITTTNGTQALYAARDARAVVIGSFLNLDALVRYLTEKNSPVIFFCAGWKNRFNMEDSLFAGAVAEQLLNSGNFSTDCDSTRAAVRLYKEAKGNLFEFLSDSSHRQRLAKLNLEKDIRYCLQLSTISLVPEFRDGKIAVPQ